MRDKEKGRQKRKIQSLCLFYFVVVKLNDKLSAQQQKAIQQAASMHQVSAQQQEAIQQPASMHQVSAQQQKAIQQAASMH